MTTRTLRLAKDLTLPLDAATESFAILGRRGSGKTHTAVVMAEEMLKAGVQVVVIDPLDVWWGLRVSKDGKTAGFPIYVAGGSHQDIPLSADAGKVLADAVVDQGLSIVLSTRHLSKTDQRRFVGEFCERLYDRKADPQHRTALHVFIDEADAFVPQRLMPGAERCFGAVDTMVRRGRSSGLAVTLISQRPQVINKDVLSQTEVLVSHQLTGPQDRKALQAWIEANDDENRSAEFVGALASLPKGRAWFWSPGLLKVFKPVDIRDRETFDSSATPKPGVVGVKPKAFAAVDLDKLTAEIAATIEKAKADDPRELRKQIAELQKTVQKHTSDVSKTQIERVSTPLLTDGDRALLAKTATMLEQMAGHIGEKSETLIFDMKDRLAAFARDLHEDAEAIHQRARLDFAKILDGKGFTKILDKLAAVTPPQNTPTHSEAGSRTTPAASQGRRVAPAAATSRPASLPPSDGVTGPQQRILNAVAWAVSLGLPTQRREKVAFLADASPKSSAFMNNLGALRSAGLIDYPQQGLVSLTAAGAAVAHVQDDAPTTSAELQRAIYAKLPGPQVRIVDAVVRTYPNALTREEVAVRAQASPASSAFMNNLGALRSLGLIDYPRQGHVAAAPLLFLEER